MSFVISFRDYENWFTRVSFAETFFQAVRTRYQLNKEDDYELEQAIALNGLHFSLMKPAMRNRFNQMFIETIVDINDDKTGDYARDFELGDFKMYQNSLAELLPLLDKYKDYKWDDD